MNFLRSQRAWLGITLATVLIVPALSHPWLGAGWLWELANGLGFAALVCMVLLSIETGRGSSSTARHEQIAWIALALIIAHGLMLLLSDAVVVEYLKLSAPLYMLAGLAAALLLLFLVISARPGIRTRLWRHHRIFRWVHWLLGLAALVLTLWHVLGSEFYLFTHWQRWLLGLALFAVVLYLRVAVLARNLRVTLPWLFIGCALGVLAFTLVRNV